MFVIIVIIFYNIQYYRKFFIIFTVFLVTKKIKYFKFVSGGIDIRRFISHIIFNFYFFFTFRFYDIKP